jgi:actinin alpha
MQHQENSPRKQNNAWEKQQQKAFTAWVNSQLRVRQLALKDVETDLSDGKLLLQLMEIIGGDKVKLPKPARGSLRIHRVQNVNNALDFLKSKKVKLVGIGAEEVVDGNLKLILGMLWTIILRFDIEDISAEGANAKEALLLWAKRKTQGYAGVTIDNFHMSWKDGLGFCALIHRHHPELIDYDSLKKGDTATNVALAMKVTEEKLGLIPMVDAEDMTVAIKPDERSIMTQVAAYYKLFASANKGEVAAAKIATVLKTNMEHDKLFAEYERLATDLLEWIPAAIARLNERPQLGSVQACIDYLAKMADFRTKEYPEKLTEKGNLEAKHSNIQTLLRLSGRAPFMPSDGKMIEQIHEAWGGLDAGNVENKRWNLQQLKAMKLCALKAESFKRLVGEHNEWTEGKIEQLEVDDYTGQSVGTINALIKKLKAFNIDREAMESRVHDIGTQAGELDDAKYGEAETFNQMYSEVYETWNQLAAVTVDRAAMLQEALAKAEKLEEVWLEIATQAAPLISFLGAVKSDLTTTIIAETEDDVQIARNGLEELKGKLEAFDKDYEAYNTLQLEADSLGGKSSSTLRSRRSSVVEAGENPFTLYTAEEIGNLHREVLGLIPEREAALTKESELVASKEALRVKWATDAKEVDDNLKAVAVKLHGVADQDIAAALEDLVAQVKQIVGELDAYYKDAIPQVEALNKELEEAIILDNPHTTLTIDILRNTYFKLSQEAAALTSSFENQITIRDGTNITEDQMREFRESFDHFDKDKSGHLCDLEFRGCLLSLGMDIPAEAVPGDDDEFERIMMRVDPNRDNKISFAEFVAFMSEERADAETKDDFVKQLTTLAGGQPYILPGQLSDLDKELQDYCLASMPPYAGGPDGALDYNTFAEACYGSAEV